MKKMKYKFSLTSLFSLLIIRVVFMEDIMKENIKLVRRIITSINQLDGIYYLWSKKTNIQENMLAVLYALNDGKSHTQIEISQEYIIPKTTVNTVIKKCVEKGWIQLENGSNQREKTICLTETGKEYTRKIMKDIIKTEEMAIQKTLEKYSPEFIEALEYFEKNMMIQLNTILENNEK